MWKFVQRQVCRPELQDAMSLQWTTVTEQVILMILIILTWNWLQIELITWRPVLKKSRMSARQSAAPRGRWRRWSTVRKSTKKSATPWREKYVAQSSKKSAMKSSPSKVLQSSSMWMQGHTMGNLPWGATPRMRTWIQRSLQHWRRWRMSQCARPPSLKFYYSNTSNSVLKIMWL